MARYELSGTFALTANTAKTVIRVVTPASRKITVRRLLISDRLAGASDPGILVRLLSGGSGTSGTAATPFPYNDAKACLSTALLNFTAEPSGTTEIERYAVPAGGGINEPYEGEEGIVIPHSSAFAIELTATTNGRGSDLVAVKLIFEE